MIARYQSQKMQDLWSLKHRYDSFLKVELASIDALHKRGLIDQNTLNQLHKASFTLEKINEKEAILKHDVLAFIETCRETLGKEKTYFHYGLTSTDVVDTAISLILRDANTLIDEKWQVLLEVLVETIQKTKKIPMMARTHGMYAEITTLGMRFLRLYETLQRLYKQFIDARQALEVIKLSGAVGTYSILPKTHETYVRESLDLYPAEMSTQVLSRERHATYVHVLTTMASVIEGFAVDVRLLARSDVSELKEGFSKGQKGSSAMPHKKNPVTAENLTGLARMMRGYQSMTYENIALWHERDISHSSVERVMLEDVTSLAETILTRVTGMIEHIVIDREQMNKHIDDTYETAFTQTLLHLAIDAGFDRIEAYEKLQALSFQAIERQTNLSELIKQTPYFDKIHSSIDSVIDVHSVMNRITELIDTFLKEKTQ